MKPLNFHQLTRLLKQTDWKADPDLGYHQSPTENTLHFVANFPHARLILAGNEIKFNAKKYHFTDPQKVILFARKTWKFFKAKHRLTIERRKMDEAIFALGGLHTQEVPLIPNLVTRKELDEWDKTRAMTLSDFGGQKIVGVNDLAKEGLELYFENGFVVWPNLRLS